MLGCSSIDAPDVDAVAAAARVLAGGGLVVYPTETVYGLGAAAHNAPALDRLAMLKGREPGKPISLLISDLRMLDALVCDVPPVARQLIHRFWPGPLTLVLHARPGVSSVLTGDDGGIGVRISSHPMATALVRALGRPVTTPSANPAGQRPPVTVDEARAYFGPRVDCYLDGGRVHGEPASTVVDARGEWKVIREGAISRPDLLATLANDPHAGRATDGNGCAGRRP
jgi:L-threonylcarbamoyladenylate synthase